MPSVKKTRPISFEIIDEVKAMAAMEIHAMVFHSIKENEKKQKILIGEFHKTYGHSYSDVIFEMWRWHLYIFSEGRSSRPSDEVYRDYVAGVGLANKEPIKLMRLDEYYTEIGFEWVFKGFVYEVKGFYSDDEIKLLILEDFDKERRYFEKLNAKFNQPVNENTTYERPRIPENVRIEVWRRESGKCARCGSREKLEYDHIVPVSKGGSNTARNIELLCEKCNRSKSNNVV
jgi:hypothetical protein